MLTGACAPLRVALLPPEVGRQYGIKLWMFAQSLGQLEKAYPNANGMIGSCAVRSFMNPSMHDGTAERVSKELGTFDSPLDGSKQKIAEPQELAGSRFKGVQIVLPSGAKPIRVTKQFAYETEPYRSRMDDTLG
jgi:type IV secretion system protein VirD4